MKAVQGHQLALEGGQQPSCPSLARGPLVLGLVKEQAIGLWHHFGQFGGLRCR